MAYMYKSLYSKFAQNEPIHEQLMQTGDRYLIYATDDDRTWGIGIDRSGNFLSFILKNLYRIRKAKYLVAVEISVWNIN